MAKKPTRIPVLCINKCPQHGYMSVSIDEVEPDGRGGIGSRLTPSKCCGRWDVVKSWKLSAHDWEEIIKEARSALRLAKKLEKERVLLLPERSVTSGD